MKALKTHGRSILLCGMEIIVGILLLVNPVVFTTGIIIAAGAALLALGALSAARYLRMGAMEAAASGSLAKGLLLIAAGGFCVLRSDWFFVTFPMLTVIYGLFLLVSGFCKVQWTVDMLRMKIEKWYLAAIGAVVTVVCAVVVLCNPFAATSAMWLFTGISLIAQAVADFFAMILNKKESQPSAERFEVIDAEESH